jgi:hypothetical protein
MAKSQTEILPTDTLASLFSDMQAVVIMEAGSKNTDDAQGTLYNIFVPREALPNLAAYRQFINNNWDGSRHGFKDLSVADKITKAAAYPGNFEASEPSAETPLERAVRNILVRKNPKAVQGLTESQIINGMAPHVAKVLNDPARTESYYPQIVAELEAIRNWTAPRPRKGTGEKSDGLDSVNLD